MLSSEDRLQELECSITCPQVRKRVVQLIQASCYQCCSTQEATLMLVQTLGLPAQEAARLVRALATEWSLDPPLSPSLSEVALHPGSSAAVLGSEPDYDRCWQQLLA